MCGSADEAVHYLFPLTFIERLLCVRHHAQIEAPLEESQVRAPGALCTVLTCVRAM